MIFNYQFIANIGSPSIVGALWTWPPVWRAHRNFFNALNKLLIATSQMVIAGSAAANEAAYQFGQSVELLTSGVEVRGRKLVKVEDFDERVERANATLRAFLLVARAEIGLPNPDGTERRAGRRSGRSAGGKTLIPSKGKTITQDGDDTQPK